MGGKKSKEEEKLMKIQEGKRIEGNGNEVKKKVKKKKRKLQREKFIGNRKIMK